MTIYNPGPVCLWVKAEPFTFGCLPVAPHARLSYHNIKKIVQYAKTKGSAGYPRLFYSVWKHVACNKLQIPEELAWMYFTTYDSINTKVTPKERLDWDKKFAINVSLHEKEAVKNSCSVPTLEFVLFLFAQQLHKISLRTSLISGGEEWPSRTRSPEVDSGSKPSSVKSLDEHNDMVFLLNNLNEFLELLIEPESLGGTVNEVFISIEAVEALGFLIGGSLDLSSNVTSLHEIAMLPHLQQSTGFSKLSYAFSLRTFQSWLKSHISENPFGISACIARGRRLSWPLYGEDKEIRDLKRGRIATNAVFVPKDSIKGNKIIILSQCNKQTIARSSGTLENASVKIHRTNFSYIYLLSSLRSVVIEKCRQSTIVLGPVESSVHLNSCEQLKIIAPTRRISLSGCTNCILHVMTPVRPLILGGNDKIVLAPYHTYYGNLELHMQRVGLSPVPNLWDQPLCIGPDHQSDSPVWELMNVKDFYLFNIPFELDGLTTAIPGSLPSRYQRALHQYKRSIESWQQMVKASGLTKEQSKIFQSIVEQRFQEFLDLTGNKRQLDNLAVSINENKLK